MTPLTSRDLWSFNYQLAALMRKGIPIAPALGKAAEVGAGWRASEAFRHVSGLLARGLPLDEAVKGIVPAWTVGALKADEAGQCQGELLAKTTAVYERWTNHSKRLWSMAIYPAVIFPVMLFTLSVYLKVLPYYADYIHTFASRLPLPAEGILAIRQWAFANPIVAGVALAFSLALGVGLLVSLLGGLKRLQLGEAVVLRVPLFGQMYSESVFSVLSLLVSRFAEKNLPLTDALALGREMFTNPGLRAELLQLKGWLEQGVQEGKMRPVFHFIPPVFVSMVLLGIRKGNLSNAMQDLSEYLEENALVVLPQHINAAGEAFLVLTALVAGAVVILFYWTHFSVEGIDVFLG